MHHHKYVSFLKTVMISLSFLIISSAHHPSDLESNGLLSKDISKVEGNFTDCVDKSIDSNLNSSISDADNDGIANTEECTFTNLADANNLPAGVYKFDFGYGEFNGYMDDDGWLLFMQYHHAGGTNPDVTLIQPGEHLPIYDPSGLGTDNSADPTKWGHGTQDFASTIPDQNIKLKWYGETSAHNRIIHFESPILGDFKGNLSGTFTNSASPSIAVSHTLYPDHSANLPASANSSGYDGDDYTLTYAPFFKSGHHHWIVKGRYGNGSRWEVDGYPNSDQHHTIHRVWVKSDDTPTPYFCDADQDGITNILDPDSDNDGINDGSDSCPNDANNDADNDGFCDDVDQCLGFDDNLDDDNDGVPNACDNCSNSDTPIRADIFYGMDQEPVNTAEGIIDASSNTAGTLANAAGSMPYLIGGAARHSLTSWDFSQTNSYINVNANSTTAELGDINNTDGLSIGFWINLDYDSGSHLFQRVAGLEGVFDIVILNEGLEFRFAGNSYLVETTFADNVLNGDWEHFVVTFDFTNTTNNLVLYYNGEAIHTVSAAIGNSFHSVSDKLIIGARSNGTYYFPGELDDFIIFKEQICPQDVTKLYENGAHNFIDANTYSYAPISKTGGYDYKWQEYSNDPKQGICDQSIIYDYTGANTIAHVPPVGVHPRIYFSPHEIPEIKNRLLNTKSGQEALAQLKAYTILMVGDANGTYIRNADYAIDDFGNARIDNTGAWSAKAVLQSLLNNDSNFTTGGYRAASVLSLEAFETLIFKGEYDPITNTYYDDRAADLAKALTYWAEVAIEEYEENPFANTNTNFVGSELAFAYDMNYHAMTDDQRATVRKAIAINAARTMLYADDLSCYVTRSNWSTLHTFEIWPYLAIEGEEGYSEEFVKDWMRMINNFITHGWYDSGASFEGIGKNQQSVTMLVAAAKRGYSLLGHPNVKGFGQKFLPAHVHPFGGGFLGYSAWSGSGPAAITGGNKFNISDAIGLKWAYPNDPSVDFMWRNYISSERGVNAKGYVYQKIWPTNFFNNFLLPAVAFALDYEEIDFNTAAENAIEKDYFAPTRGIATFRNTTDSLSLMANFHCRQNTGGHTLADRNAFNLSSLGRIWIRKPYGGQHSEIREDRYQNCILIDDVALEVNTMPGKIIDYSEDEDISKVTGDATYAYSYTWDGFTSYDDDADISSLNDNGCQAIAKSWNDFKYAPQPDAYYDEPLYKQPDWRDPDLTRYNSECQFRPMEKVIRSMAMIRGENPFLLIVDDVKMDNSNHNYKWIAQLDLDLTIDTTIVNLDINDYRNDVIIKEPSATGNRRLLIRILNNEDQTSTAHNAYLQAISLDDIEFEEPVTEDSPNSARRLVVESNSVEPNFRVLVYPYYEGDQLPNTTWNNTRDILTVTFCNSQKVIALAPQDGGKWNKINLIENIESEDIAGTVGMPCDDGDDCTVNDTFNSNCRCVGERTIDWNFADGEGTLSVISSYDTTYLGLSCPNEKILIPDANCEAIVPDYIHDLTSDYLCMSLSTPPIALWTFDENSANTIPDNIGDADAVFQYNSPAQVQTGRIGNAVNLEGNTDESFKVNADPLANTNAFTITTWIKLTKKQNNFTGFVTSRNGADSWGFGMSPNGGVSYFTPYENGAVQNITPGKWYHFTLTWSDTGHITVYVDGIKVIDKAITAGPYISNGSWAIGEDECCGGRELDGQIDETAFFDTVLNEEEIAYIYTNGLEGKSILDEYPVLSQDPLPGTVISGLTNVTITAEDFSGNVEECSFDIHLSESNGIICNNETLDTDNDGVLNIDECILTSLTDAKSVAAGIHKFDFGNGPFNAYVDSEGWVLWLQYHHLGGTNPDLNIIPTDQNLPNYDPRGLGTDNSNDLTKWGHGSQDFAASIPDQNIKLRWHGITSNHDRVIHFESESLGDFQANVDGNFVSGPHPPIQSTFIPLIDHTATIPATITNGADNRGDYTLTEHPFYRIGQRHWMIKGLGQRWEVDDYYITDQANTVHRVWVKSNDTPNSFVCDIDMDSIPNVLDTDSDNDGVSDALDICPTIDDNLIGQPCDDGDPCTIGTSYSVNCQCDGGQFQDADNDGVCDANDICPNGDDTIDTNNNGTPDACDLDCIDYLNVLGFQVIDSDTSATISILTNGTIPAGQQIDYNAGSQIELWPGFEVELGAVFHAFLEPCGSVIDE